MQNRHSCYTCPITLAALVAGFFAVAIPAWGQERGILNEDIKFLANDAGTKDFFGWSVAVDNSILAVGAVGDDDNGTNSGSAYLFDVATGTQTFKLLPDDGLAFDFFGNAIAINKGVVAVGARLDDDNGPSSGSAYLFDATTGAQFSKLLPIDGSAFDFFGNAIALDHFFVAVGAKWDDARGSNSGSVYVFITPSGSQITKLLPSDGEANDEFGYSVAVANGIVAVGAPFWDNEKGLNYGSAYLFDAETGVQLAKLIPSDGQAGDEFGFSIALANGIVAVGARLDDANGTDSGSAYLFDAETGAQISKLIPSDGSAFDMFGRSISIDSGVVAVGAWSDDDNGMDSGSAYLFDALTGTQIDKILPSDGAAEDFFGTSIALINGIVAVGSYFDDDNGPDSGSAYVFDINICLADLTGDGTVDALDFFLFVGLFAFEDPQADLNFDDIVDVMDFFEFVNLFVAGCP